MRNQAVSIFAHFEKIRLFLCRFDFPPTIRAFPVYQLGFRPKRFAGRAIQPFISPFINIPLVIKLLKNLLYLLFVRFVCRTDKVIIGSIHQIPQLLYHACDVIHIFFWRNAAFLRFQFNFLPMLVRSGLEKNVITVFSLKSGNTVGQHNLIAVPDMRFAGCIGNCRGDIIFPFTHFPFSFRLSIHK